MIKETFRRIEYSDETKFLKTADRIELKEYTDDLIFLANYNSSLDAQFSTGVSVPTITGAPENADFDSFGLTQHCNLKGSLTYEYGGFTTLIEEGKASFRLSSGFDNVYGEQTFKNENPATVLATTNYGFKLYLDGAFQADLSITLDAGATKVDVFNAFSVEVAPYANVIYDTLKIKMLSLVLAQLINIEDPDSGESLLTLMGGVETPVVPNGPSVDIDFFKLTPLGNLSNAIILTHTTTSHILIKMYNSSGTLIVNEDAGIWSNTSAVYDEFEISWNESIGQLFIGGRLKHLFLTGFTRENILTNLVLQGIDETDYHKIDEVVLKNTFGNTKDYTPTTIPLTMFSAESPYVDIFFGDGFKENEVTDLVINSSIGTNFIVKIGHSWYYYYSGAWRASDGTFAQSSTADIFETQFLNLFFNENYDLDIRVFFHTDGYENVWIDEFSIITEVGNESAAFITGTVAITGTVDLSTDKSVEITTLNGNVAVDLSSAAIDTSAVTLAEIKQAIDDAAIPGLASASDDGDGHLVLLSTSTGNEAIVAIDHALTDSALDLIWDTEGSTDLGEDTEIITEFSDYSSLYSWVRSSLGAPLVPVELTDEQLDNCISSAVYNWNKWRNFTENLETIRLVGSPAIGYEIPAITGGPTNITDVILEPRYPASYYYGRGELMNNLWIQAMYNNPAVMANAADYHISLVAGRDLNIILNTTPTWEFINNRLFILPEPPPSLRVGIKYKSALSLSEIINSQAIKDFTLAEAKIALGNIRSTFGNQVPGGDGMLQLNGSELKQEGKQEKEELKASWKSSTNVYEFIIG
jgi:hypothetical protein